MSLSPHSAVPASDTPAELIRQRLGAETIDTENWNSALEAMLSHRSVRSYLPQPVPDDVLRLGIAAAQSAPTSSGLQAWSVVAVEDPARRAKLAELASPNPQILSAPLFLVWLADLSRLRTVAVDNGKVGDGLDYLESFLLAAIDASLAAQNAVVAFESLGLGTCYIGGMRNNPIDVGAVLGLPPESFAVFGLTVGYPDPTVATDIKPRLPQSLVLHRETYQLPLSPVALESYDSRMQAFQAAQGMAVRGWTRVMAGRIADAAALKGRDRLKEIVRAMGFKLK